MRIINLEQATQSVIRAEQALIEARKALSEAALAGKPSRDLGYATQRVAQCEAVRQVAREVLNAVQHEVSPYGSQRLLLGILGRPRDDQYSGGNNDVRAAYADARHAACLALLTDLD